MRLLSVDFGFKRIGLASGDLEFRIASPKGFIEASGKLNNDAKALKDICDKEKYDALVLGIPYNADNSIGKQANVCLQLADKLEKEGLVVYKIDEFLSSYEAETELKSMGYKASARRKLSDAEAATRILERFFKEFHAKD